MNAKNFIDWAKKQDASTLDIDKAYGLQCVDLAKNAIVKIRGIKAQSIGHAIEYYNKRNSEYVKSIAKGGEILTFKKGDKPKPILGDIVVFYNEKDVKVGHIAIAAGDNKTDGFYSYDTNWKNQNDKYDKVEKVFHKYNSSCWCICIIRMAEKYTGVTAPAERVYKVVDANNGLYAYKDDKFKTSIVLPNKTKVELIASSVATMKKNNTNYKMALIKHNGERYYTAEKFLK